MPGHITSIDALHDFKIQPIAPYSSADGHSRIGLGQMINSLGGFQKMEGYAVKTDAGSVYLVLIDSQASCCESFGYIASDDDLPRFVGAELLKVELTDSSRFKEDLEELQWLDEGGVQFVDFVTDRGVFQLAVYNGHNGYYGHGILVARDDEILLNGTL